MAEMCTRAFVGPCVGVLALAATARGQTGIVSIDGTLAGEQFGSAVALVPDLDLDGKAEIAVGAPLGTVAGGAAGAGAVRVYTSTGVLLWEAAGPGTGSRFGAALAALDDWNGDGRAELLVGAWQANLQGAIGAGIVRVLSGANGAVLLERRGDTLNDHMGWTVANGGDLDGDGRDDPVATAIDDDDGGGSSGSVRAWSSSTGATLWTLHGNAPLQLYGSSIASMGDLDGDGVPEIAIGGPFAGSVMTAAGVARVHSGATGIALREWSGLALRDAFGSAVAAIGDVNGDGVPDLAVGARQSAATGPGYVQILSGADGAVLAIHAGDPMRRAFGLRLAAAGDADYDGIGDLWIGAPEASLAGNASGAVRLVALGSGSTLQELTGTAASQRYGAALAAGIDLDGNGSPDLTAGAPGAAAPSTNTGRVLAHSGNDLSPPEVHAPLEADVAEMSLSGGGGQRLFLRAGLEHARAPFWMLGSLHGDVPGLARDGFTVPLNADRYFCFTVHHPRFAPLAPARGDLDDQGEAEVLFQLARCWQQPYFVGRTFHHAFVVVGADGRLEFASNSVACTIVP